MVRRVPARTGEGPVGDRSAVCENEETANCVSQDPRTLTSSYPQQPWRRVGAQGEPAKDRSGGKESVSGSASQCYDGEVPLSIVEGHLHFQANAKLALYQGHRLGARRRTWPAWSWFEPRLAIRGTMPTVDLVRCSASQGHVRTMPVVPRSQFQGLSQEGPSTQRDQPQPGEVLPERKNRRSVGG